MTAASKDIWVFGDWRNYFQNRITLQLLARARELAHITGGRVCAVVFGQDVAEWVDEYIAHGAQTVYVASDPALYRYRIGAFTALMVGLAEQYRPETILVGATGFGREFAPKVAKRLNTGLTADCIGLDIDADGLLVQTAPSFGGNLIAKIVTPQSRPQMATVRPGIFQEIPHNAEAIGEVVEIPVPGDLPGERVRLVSTQKQPPREQRLEDARVVICGGRGMGSKAKFKKLFELARLMEGEVGATRPVVYAGWADPEALVGQAGRHVRPQVLISCGISGAIQHTAAIGDADFVIAVNKNENATMMRLADVAVVADANQFCTALIRALKERLRG
ncbi:MAG: electron transfer flavoprotein subunit alpha/FixB family protein [Desulfobacterales bacterium]|nr:electron transfer flavoprotein subunit alpha/FixB family protein [Desulfobacterales bacterium]